MQNRSGKFTLVLLVVLGVLQFVSLNRQAELTHELASLRNRHMMLEAQVGSLSTQILPVVNPEERWLTVEHPLLTPVDTCTEAMVQMEWHLQEWTAGTKSNLVYRSSPGEPWRVASIKPLGEASYQATFWLPIKPTFQFGIDIDYGQGVAVAPAQPAVEVAPTPQFQITAEVDGITRSTGVKPIAGTERFQIPAKVRLQVGKDGDYTARLSTHQPDGPSCQRIEAATVEVFAGDKLIATLPFTTPALASGDWGQAQWRTKEPLTKLNFRFLHAGGEEVIPVPLPAR